MTHKTIWINRLRIAVTFLQGTFVCLGRQVSTISLHCVEARHFDTLIKYLLLVLFIIINIIIIIIIRKNYTSVLQLFYRWSRSSIETLRSRFGHLTANTNPRFCGQRFHLIRLPLFRGSQWGGGFYGYRLKFWLFYGYRLIILVTVNKKVSERWHLMEKMPILILRPEILYSESINVV